MRPDVWPPLKAIKVAHPLVLLLRLGVFKLQNRKDFFVRTDYPDGPRSREIKACVSLLNLAACFEHHSFLNEGAVQLNEITEHVIR